MELGILLEILVGFSIRWTDSLHALFLMIVNMRHFIHILASASKILFIAIPIEVNADWENRTDVT